MKLYWSNGRVVLWQGHVLDCLAAMEAGSVHMVATSPPYYSLRDYDLPPVEWPAVSYAPMAGLPPLDIPGCDPGCEHVWGEASTAVVGNNRNVRGKNEQRDEFTTEKWKETEHQHNITTGQYCQLCGGWRGCLGLEATPEAFVGHIVLVARALWRVLRDDGTFWLNLGSSYQDKQELGIPWRVAFALQADNWILRSDIIWAKGVSFCPTYSGSCMPGSQKDRPTTSHEHVFLLSKKARYFYDNEAVKESADLSRVGQKQGRWGNQTKASRASANNTKPSGNEKAGTPVIGGTTRTLRSVWTINPGNFPGSHFATFPPKLVEPMIKAGTSQRGACPSCGSSWERVTEKSGVVYDGNRSDDTVYTGQAYGDRAQSAVRGPARNLTGSDITTTGWTPACSCYDWEHCAVCGEEMDGYDKEHGDSLSCGHNICAECLIVGEAAEHVRECELAPVPCTVLDPFLGSGTTAEVADFLGRHSVGIELSKSYCDDHIIPRLTEPLFEWAAQEPEQEPEPEIEQLGLL